MVHCGVGVIIQRVRTVSFKRKRFQTISDLNIIQIGQLGLGSAVASVNEPTQVPNTKGFTSVGTGRNFSIAVNSNGQVSSFGCNSHGQLGFSELKNKDIPTIQPDLTNISSISVGYRHTLALTNDGVVHSFGFNHNGELGVGDKIGTNISECSNPHRVMGNIVQISSGFNHNLLLTRDHQVYVFGLNTFGKLRAICITVTNH
jgi:alpha-tubulin suppressor-like RCC1 family protein